MERSLILGLLALSSTVWAARSGAGEEPVDVLLLGRFVTLDPERPEASALAVRNGRVVAIGDVSEVGRRVGPPSRRLRVPGVAFPGFADAHAHPASLGDQLESLDLRGLTKEEIVAKVAAAARATPPGEWIRGGGWDQGFWAPAQFPTAADLDAATGAHPVALDRIDLHSVWLNSRALAAAGITAATPEPEGGRIVRGSVEAPTGILIDSAMSLLDRALPPLTAPQRERRLRRALDQYLRWGVTSVHDAGADPATLALYRRLAADRALPLRVYAMAQGFGEAAEAALAEGPILDAGDGRLAIRSFKVVLDGALGSRGAQLAAPYADAPGERGLETFSDADLRELLRRAVARGFQVCAHAIGDHGNRRALDAFEALGEAARRLRFRIEHASVVAPSDRARFARLGVVASVQPVFVGEYGRWAAERVGPARATWVLATRSLLEAGARLAFGTDYPAADSGRVVDTLYCAVTRRGADGHPEDPWHAAERLTVDEALVALTKGPAYGSFQENDLGALVVGGRADLTVLSGDPRATKPEDLRSLDVRMTIVDGQVVYEAPAP